MMLAGLRSMLVGRLRAADELSASTDLDSLVGWLGHRNSQRRAQAAHRLGQLARPEAIGPLANAAADPKREVRRAALTALWLIDPNAFAETAVQLAARAPRADLFQDLDSAFSAASRSQSFVGDEKPLG